MAAIAPAPAPTAKPPNTTPLAKPVPYVGYIVILLGLLVAIVYFILMGIYKPYNKEPQLKLMKKPTLEGKDLKLLEVNDRLEMSVDKVNNIITLNIVPDPTLDPTMVNTSDNTDPLAGLVKNQGKSREHTMKTINANIGVQLDESSREGDLSLAISPFNVTALYNGGGTGLFLTSTSTSNSVDYTFKNIVGLFPLKVVKGDNAGTYNELLNELFLATDNSIAYLPPKSYREQRVHCVARGVNGVDVRLFKFIDPIETVYSIDSDKLMVVDKVDGCLVPGEEELVAWVMCRRGASKMGVEVELIASNNMSQTQSWDTFETKVYPVWQGDIGETGTRVDVLITLTLY